jgi:hypothetical protein
MRVELGHTAGMDVVDGEQVRIEGERITTFDIPEDTGPSTSMAIILDALPHHIAEGNDPAWVVCPDKTLRDMLVKHFDLGSNKTRRPANWGKEKNS